MFKNNLKYFRQTKGLTQKKLAKMLGVTTDYIYMIERGIRSPRLHLAKKISDILEVSIEEIFFKDL